MTYIFVYGDEFESHETAFNLEGDQEVSVEEPLVDETWEYSIESGVLTLRYDILDDGQYTIIKFGTVAVVVLGKPIGAPHFVPRRKETALTNILEIARLLQKHGFLTPTHQLL